MKIIQIFTRIIDTKPGETIMYKNSWYKVINVMKDILTEDIVDNNPMTKLTLTVEPLPDPEQIYNIQGEFQYE